MNQQENQSEAKDLTLAEQIDSQEIVEVRRFTATVTLTLPNRKVAGRYLAGAMILAKQTLTNEMVDQAWIDERVAQGYLIEEKSEAPTFREVRENLDVVELNVSAVVKGGLEDNPLDGGIDLVSKGDDPALEARLSDIADEQEELGIENDGDDLEPESVQINAETGEVTRTGESEIDFDDDERQADSQVS